MGIVSLTDPQQFLLGLGMMAADPRSRLSRGDRARALFWVQEAGMCPPGWRPAVRAYLESRARHQQKGPPDDR